MLWNLKKEMKRLQGTALVAHSLFELLKKGFTPVASTWSASGSGNLDRSQSLFDTHNKINSRDNLFLVR